MIQIRPHELEALNLSVQDIAAYALHHGWQKISHPNPGLMVFQELVAVEDDEPIHLVIPNQDRFRDIPIRLADAVNLLAAVGRTFG